MSFLGDMEGKGQRLSWDLGSTLSLSFYGFFLQAVILAIVNCYAGWRCSVLFSTEIIL